jgi:hypothetical protein
MAGAALAVRTPQLREIKGQLFAVVVHQVPGKMDQAAVRRSVRQGLLPGFLAITQRIQRAIGELAGAQDGVGDFFPNERDAGARQVHDQARSLTGAPAWFRRTRSARQGRTR